MAVAGVFAATLLGGCANPYAMGVTRLNYDAPQQAGSIQFTDPKLYRREALINERRQEVAYLDELLNASKTIAFTPEVIRELEVISSLSASLGLKFDPAAAAANRRADETTALQQEIQTMKLQLQLDQLKRDAELFRANLPQQQTVSNPDLGKGDAGTTPTQTAITAPTADALVTAVNAMQTALQNRLGATVPGAVRSTAGTSPIDSFQDRAAYRNLLNSAKNAANLDELHDKDGSALLRLYFAATVLPPRRDYLDTLGMLRMEVIEPRWKYGDLERVYRDWLSYVNRNINLYREAGQGGAGYSENPSFLPFSTGDLFDLAYFYYRRPGSQAACPGIRFRRAAEEDIVAGCGRLSIAMPRPRDLVSGVRNGSSRADVGALYEILAGRANQYIPDLVRAANAMAVGDGALFADDCGLDRDSAFARSQVGGTTMLDALDVALTAYFVSGVLSEIELQARKTLADNGVDQPPPSEILTGFSGVNAAAGQLINEFISLGGRRPGRSCTVFVQDHMPTHVPPRFMEGFRSQHRIAIYEVGPREQVQQVSTVARAADAIGLAAAIAGQVPTRGLGMSGNLAYARSATGKADALERVPLAIAFAEAGSIASDGTPAATPAFGWLLGPRVSLDPKKQKLLLEQRLKPYDLSVDLSVPGWWPYVYLKAQTAWAPDWRSGGGRTLTAGATEKTIKVELSPNSADMAALTNILSGFPSIRLSSISDIFPRTVSACASNTELQIIGENIWRTNTVIIGGRKFDGAAINILPDMNGIRVTLDTAIFPALEMRDRAAAATVTALTPYGRATGELRVVQAKGDGTCATAEAG